MRGLNICKISCNFTSKGRTSMSPLCSEIYTFFKNARPPMQHLKVFRDFAEFILKVYLSMEAESAIGLLNSWDLPWIVLSNSYDLQWFELKSKHFRLEV